MPTIQIPPAIRELLNRGAALAVSISGGKDSQAMALAINRTIGVRRRGELYLIHANLGRMEWAESLPMCRQIGKQTGIPLFTVRAEHDLLRGMYDRAMTLKGSAPFWPSPAARYCTARQKRDPIDKHLRRHEIVISAEGVRAEESASRSKKPVMELRDITGKYYQGMSVADAIQNYQPGRGRLAITWRPIFDWTLEDVWEEIGYDTYNLAMRQWQYTRDPAKALRGWKAHPAYVYGNERVSCAFCIMASKNDLSVGRKHNPWLWQFLVAMEKRWNCSFQHRSWLRDIPIYQGMKDEPRKPVHQLALFDCATC